MTATKKKPTESIGRDIWAVIERYPNISTPRSRAIAKMYYYYGMTDAEIAEMANDTTDEITEIRHALMSAIAQGCSRLLKEQK